MSYDEDWNRGRQGLLPNGRDNEAYREGLRAREAWMRETTSSPLVPHYGGAAPREVQPQPHAPFTLSGSARSGAMLFVVGYALYALTALHLSWPVLGARALLAAFAGLLAGVFFFAAVHIVKFALKALVIVCAIALILQFFGMSAPMAWLLRTFDSLF